MIVIGLGQIDKSARIAADDFLQLALDHLSVADIVGVKLARRAILHLADRVDDDIGAPLCPQCKLQLDRVACSGIDFAHRFIIKPLAARRYDIGTADAQTGY